MIGKRLTYFAGAFVVGTILLMLVAILSPVGLLTFTPILFFGKVVDEKGSPLDNAEIHVSYADSFWTNDTKVTQRTDANGSFFCLGRGLGIIVENISRDGFYDLLQSKEFQKTDHVGSYGYARGLDNFAPHPDPRDPAIFVLKKAGKLEPLVSVAADVRIAKDGTPVWFDLRLGRSVAEGRGDVEIETWTHDEDHRVNSNAPYAWNCRISVPGGGLLTRTGNFDFIAPVDGYSPTAEINMPVSMGKDWRSQVTRRYFLHLPGERYARMEFTMTAGGDHFLTIMSLLNPRAGSRNLERGSAGPGEGL